MKQMALTAAIACTESGPGVGTAPGRGEQFGPKVLPRGAIVRKPDLLENRHRSKEIDVPVGPIGDPDVMGAAGRYAAGTKRTADVCKPAGFNGERTQCADLQLPHLVQAKDQYVCTRQCLWVIDANDHDRYSGDCLTPIKTLGLSTIRRLSSKRTEIFQMSIGGRIQAQFNMVEQQIRPWEVLDQRVLKTMGTIPRDKFVPQEYTGLAYADIEIPLDHGRRLLFPRIEGRLLQALDIQPEDRILEVGTGCGHLTACLAHLGNHVTSVDCHQDFLDRAGERLTALGIENVTLELESDLLAPEAEGPFDVIAVTAALPAVTEALKQKLAIGGRLFAIAGDSPVMEATLVTRVGEESWRTESLFETTLEPFETAPRAEAFEF